MVGKIGLLMLLMMILMPIGCQDQGKEITASLSIYAGMEEAVDDDETILETTAITFREGQTVLDILKKATRESGIQMEYTGVGLTAYVTGIDNRYEFDEGPDSGWLYFVNGEEIQQSAGVTKPEAGDEIVWRYKYE